MCISKQLLLLSGDVETNPGPVKLCPHCSLPVNIRVLVCNGCGHVFSNKGRPISQPMPGVRQSKRIAIKKQQDKVSQAKRHALETKTDTVQRKERDRVSRAKKLALETDANTVLRKEKDRISRARARALLARQVTIATFHKKVKTGLEFVCTVCHRMMYKKCVVSLNKDKYTKVSTDIVQKVFSKDNNYVCADGKQWITRGFKVCLLTLYYEMHIILGEDENETDMLRSILSQLEYRFQIKSWDERGVPFSTYIYIPEVHPLTKKEYHEREDFAHVLKVCT